MTFSTPMTDAERLDARRRDDHHRELVAKQKDHVCGECGAILGIFPQWPGGSWQRGMKPADTTWELLCSQDRSHHGIVKLPSLTQRYLRGQTLPLHIINRIEARRRHEVTQDLALPDRQALARYEGKRALTQAEAEHILNAIWPDAPREEKVRAAMLCESYRLNPLMKHVFLIPFEKKNREGTVLGKTWATVMGIDATRLLASRRAPYSVIDGPRVMTDDEQMHIFGEVDAGSVVAVTVVADSAGNRAPGYGKWPRVNRWGKANEPQGTDKGNSMMNMAMIRSERNALKRLRPAEMPDVEVVDADYVVLPAIDGDGPAMVDTSTGEVMDSPIEAEVAPDAAEEIEANHSPTEPEPEAPATDPAPEPPPAPPELTCVNDLTKAAHEKYGLQPKQVYAILGVTSSVEIGPDLDAAWAEVVASQEGQAP